VKIHADKIEAPPQHALTIRSLKRILAAVPPVWREGLIEVRLCNSLEHAPWAFFHRYDGMLTIHSRGCSLEATVTTILSELAAVSLGLTTRQRHQLSEAEAHRIHQLVEPLVEELLPAMTPAKQSLGYHPSRAFHPVSLTEDRASN
jgi:hypothetical protein